MSESEPLPEHNRAATPTLTLIQKTVLAQTAAAVVKDVHPLDRISILIIATVLVIRDFLTWQDVQDRGRRMKIVKTVVAEFDKKLREYVH